MSSTSASIQTDEEWLKKAISERHIKFIAPERLSIRDRLGSGGFGTVYLAEWDHGIKITVAAKFLKNLDERKSDRDSYKEFIKEMQFLREANCYDNILKFYGISKDTKTDQYILIIEYCNGGSLRSYLERNFRTMTGVEKLQLAKEVISGLICLHQDGILHRDLNSVNILVHDGVIKIGDLGLSKRTDDSNSNTSEVRGHAAYVDPQCFKNASYIRNEKSDVYSLGVVLWELSSGRPPFQGLGRDMVVCCTERGEREKQIRGTPTPYINLYTRCWHESPNERPSANEAYNLVQRIIWPDTNNVTIPGGGEKSQITNEMQALSIHQINDSISITKGSATSSATSNSLVREQYDIQILGNSETNNYNISSRQISDSISITEGSDIQILGRQESEDSLAKRGVDLVSIYAHRVRALYDYTSSLDEDLSFAKDEEFKVIVNNKDEWWQAKKSDGTTGKVPSNYIQIISGNPVPKKQVSITPNRARALYGYTSSLDEDLSFAKGEELDIIGSMGEWWQARNSYGRVGTVPSNYFQAISENQHGKP